ncbi:hypothetical protein G0U57_004137, partial [Chelydra serpentina]
MVRVCGQRRPRAPLPACRAPACPSRLSAPYRASAELGAALGADVPLLPLRRHPGPAARALAQPNRTVGSMWFHCFEAVLRGGC